MVRQPIHGRNFGCRIKSKFIIILYRILQNLAANYFTSLIGHSLPNSIHSCQPEHLTIPPSTIQWNVHHVEGIVLSQLQLFPHLFSKCSPSVSLFFFLYKEEIFFFNKVYLFIYLFIYLLAVLGLRFCARAFSSCGKRGPLFIAVCGPLTIVASLVAERRLQTRRLSSCGSRA